MSLTCCHLRMLRKSPMGLRAVCDGVSMAPNKSMAKKHTTPGRTFPVDSGRLQAMLHGGGLDRQRGENFEESKGRIWNIIILGCSPLYY